MAFNSKKNENKEYEELKRALKEGGLKRVYAFHGAERYLLDHYLLQLRTKFLSGDFDEFNYKRLEGKGLTLGELNEAVDALPVFDQSTFIEVIDFDFSKCDDEMRKEIHSILSDFPDYSCIVFVFTTVEYKLDARVKINSAIKKLITAVEFKEQDKADLIPWIGRHLKANKKTMDRQNAEYLAFICGGLMNSLKGEIDKLCAYSKNTEITKEDIDAVVTPVPDAEIYEMTDAIISDNFKKAVEILTDLLSMQIAPHRIIYGISSKMRQLLTARVCIDEGAGFSDFMGLAGLRYDFQGRGIMNAARKTDISRCKRAVKAVSETACMMNSTSGDYGDMLKQLLGELAVINRGK